MFLQISAIIVGILVFVGLIWIPVIGPFVSGLAIVWISKTKPKESFKLGIISAILGSLTLMMILVKIGLPYTSGPEQIISAMFVWIIIVYTLFSMLVCAVGAFSGSVFMTAKKTLEFVDDYTQGNSGNLADSITYVICPVCGISSKESEKHCPSCNRAFIL